MYFFRPLMRHASAFPRPIRLFSGGMLRKQMFSARFQSTSTKAPPKKGLKELMKEYGYSALGVYLGLSAIDLPICYCVVHLMGQDKIEYYENKVKQTFGFGISDEDLKRKQEINSIHEEAESDGNVENKSFFSTLTFSWAEFAIAYGIHKSLIFIRVPITAAITPGIVKALRRWGFKIGSDKLSTTATIAKDAITDITASNPKFGTKPNGKKRWFSWFF